MNPGSRVALGWSHWSPYVLKSKTVITDSLEDSQMEWKVLCNQKSVYLNSSFGFAVYLLCIFWTSPFSILGHIFLASSAKKIGGGGLDELCPETLLVFIFLILKVVSPLLRRDMEMMLSKYLSVRMSRGLTMPEKKFILLPVWGGPTGSVAGQIFTTWCVRPPRVGREQMIFYVV